ncbi:cell division protein FtsQ [Oceanidesulfovibrio indonesiensis]|uniref:Cell division protein FtsQ n=1 Tax=Oceanidesulfovibrio indonesiensis TaxID=54767 RepID=A0A7M3MK22_9BACT|nr:FtsQ-type POTRA domain-containing protein [Oceanidesulfovibrio indonesiensis]TVM19781.1 cell division protein FtsQ [Oceanidesulfovibrio indonesiensis]
MRRKNGGNRYAARKDRAGAALKAIAAGGRGVAPTFFKTVAVSGTFVLAVAFFLAISLGLLAGYRYMTQHEYFALKKLEVSGNKRLANVEVLSAAGVSLGQNTLELNMRDVEAGLLANPWVERALVKRVLPSTFRVTVFERTPRYWRRKGEQLYYTDAQGRTIAPVTAHQFASMPLLAGEDGDGVESALFERLPELEAILSKGSLPFSVEQASWIRTNQAGEIELHFQEAGITLGLGAQDLDGNIRRLSLVYQDLTRRGELERVKALRAHGRRVWVQTQGSIAG